MTISHSGDHSFLVGHCPDQLAVQVGEDDGLLGVGPTADLVGKLNPGVPDALAQPLELSDVEDDGTLGHCLPAVHAGSEVDDAHLKGFTHGGGGGVGRGRNVASLLAHAIDKACQYIVHWFIHGMKLCINCLLTLRWCRHRWERSMVWWGVGGRGGILQHA